MNKFKKARVKEGLSVAEMAQRVGASRGSVYNWESGARTPQDRHVFALVENFGETYEYWKEQK